MTTQELRWRCTTARCNRRHRWYVGRPVPVDAGRSVAPAKLVFEVDAARQDGAWRVGLSPQVDYVEGGCS